MVGKVLFLLFILVPAVHPADYADPANALEAVQNRVWAEEFAFTPGRDPQKKVNAKADIALLFWRTDPTAPVDSRDSIDQRQRSFFCYRPIVNPDLQEAAEDLLKKLERAPKRKGKKFGVKGSVPARFITAWPRLSEVQQKILVQLIAYGSTQASLADAIDTPSCRPGFLAEVCEWSYEAIRDGISAELAWYNLRTTGNGLERLGRVKRESDY